MPLIDDKIVQLIKQSADIEDVVGEFVTLDYARNRQGKRHIYGLCPFHDDKHLGSFVVDTQKQRCTCYPCNKSWDAVAFVMDILDITYPEALSWLANRYNVPMDGSPYTPDPNRKKPSPPVQRLVRTWPRAWVNASREHGNDAFCQWVRSLPWDGAQAARVDIVLNNYLVGHTHFKDHWDPTLSHDFTIFWQVDETGTVHNGHLMKYKDDGHRDKNDSYKQTWIHARMRRAKGDDRFDDNIHRESYCLFGLHLLHIYPNATVNIVESEKTAIIASIAYNNPHYSLWMATTGLSRLNKDSLMPIIKAGRSIVLWPDHDGIEQWREAAEKIGYNRMCVNVNAMTQWWKPEDGEKADLADIIENRLKAGVPPKGNPQQTARTWAQKNPALERLINTYQLEAVSLTTPDGKIYKNG